MLHRNDLVDAVLRHLTSGRPAGERGALPSVRGRPFLTDREVRKSLTPETQVLTIPRAAIVSPLALEWLALKGIRIVRI